MTKIWGLRVLWTLLGFSIGCFVMRWVLKWWKWHQVRKWNKWLHDKRYTVKRHGDG